MDIISPCSMCVEANCDNCACSICKSGVGKYFSDDETNMFNAALSNPEDGNKFVNRLLEEKQRLKWWDENYPDVMLTHNWRGFKKQVASRSDITGWIYSHFNFDAKEK